MPPYSSPLPASRRIRFRLGALLLVFGTIIIIIARQLTSSHLNLSRWRRNRTCPAHQTIYLAPNPEAVPRIVRTLTFSSHSELAWSGLHAGRPGEGERGG